jgi:hypothetical protein
LGEVVLRPGYIGVGLLLFLAHVFLQKLPFCFVVEAKASDAGERDREKDFLFYFILSVLVFLLGAARPLTSNPCSLLSVRAQNASFTSVIVFFFAFLSSRPLTGMTISNPAHT